jgi:hypothetical protein
MVMQDKKLRNRILLWIGAVLLVGIVAWIVSALLPVWTVSMGLHMIVAGIVTYFVARKILSDSPSHKSEALWLFALMSAAAIVGTIIGLGPHWYIWFVGFVVTVGLGTLFAYRQTTIRSGVSTPKPITESDTIASRWSTILIILAVLLVFPGLGVYLTIFDYLVGGSGWEGLVIIILVPIVGIGGVLTILAKIMGDNKPALVIAIITNVAIVATYGWTMFDSVPNSNDIELQEIAGRIVSTVSEDKAWVGDDGSFISYKRTNGQFVAPDPQYANLSTMPIKFKDRTVKDTAASYVDADKLAVIQYYGWDGVGQHKYDHYWIVTDVRPISEYSGEGLIGVELTGHFDNYQVDTSLTFGASADFTDENSGCVFTVSELDYDGARVDRALANRIIQYAKTTGERVRIQTDGGLTGQFILGRDYLPPAGTCTNWDGTPPKGSLAIKWIFD